MLVNKSKGNFESVDFTRNQTTRSKLWFLVVIPLFLCLIVLPLWVLLRFGFLYLPFFSDKFLQTVYPSELVLPKEVNQQTLTNNFSLDNEFWYLSLSEEELTYLLHNYLGDKWQILLFDSGFELYGPVISAVNNEDLLSYVKILYKQGVEMEINFNNFILPAFLNDIIIEKYFNDNNDGDASKTIYIEGVLLEENKMVFYGKIETWQELINNIDYDNLARQLINYFISD